MSRIDKTKALIRDRFGSNQARFARAIKRSPNLVWQYLNGHRVMGEKFARHIERTLRLPKGWLDEPTHPNQVQEGTPAVAWSAHSEAEFNDIEVPVIHEVEAEEDSGRKSVKEDFEARFRFDQATLDRAGVYPEHVVSAYVSGNSMEPLLSDGAVVGIDTNNHTITDGRLYAIDHDGHLRIKQLYRVPASNGIRIRSFNHSEHPDEEYAADYVQQHIRIIGRVFWSATFW